MVALNFIFARSSTGTERNSSNFVLFALCSPSLSRSTSSIKRPARDEKWQTFGYVRSGLDRYDQSNGTSRIPSCLYKRTAPVGLSN